jgi:hypothetical protein
MLYAVVMFFHALPTYGVLPHSMMYRVLQISSLRGAQLEGYLITDRQINFLTPKHMPSGLQGNQTTITGLYVTFFTFHV